VPFLGLGSLAIFLGYIGSDAFVGMGTSFFENSIYIHPSHEKLINTEFALTSLDKNLASIFSLGGALLAIYLYNFQPLALIQMKQVFRPAYVFLNAF
jgi:NADH-ubiquinone oxidoreductase chain 5